MANSTHVITDLKTLATTAFTAASVQKSEASGGDNLSLAGMANGAFEDGSALKNALELIAANCDSADPQLTLANNILGTLT